MASSELSAEENISQLEELFEVDPTEYGSELIAALIDMSRNLITAGRFDGAMFHASRAVDISRQIGFAEAESILPKLAAVLTTLGTKLATVDRISEAIAATQEAVDLRRQLARRDPEAYQHRLAASLASLGTKLATVDRISEAIAATQEAVDLRRQLARRDPEAYQHRLAMSLTQLSNQLDCAARKAEALSVSLEAIRLFRSVAAAPGETEEVVLRGLATALILAGYEFRTAGNSVASTASFTEAVDLLHQINDPELEMQTLYALAEACEYQENLDDADNIYRRMLALSNQFDDGSN